MKAEDENDTNETRASWLEHPYTREQTRLQATREQSALKALLGLCGQSSDPKVTAAHAKYVEQRVITEFFRSGAPK